MIEMEQGIRIAIVGSTGLVGSTFLRILEESNLVVEELKLFARHERVLTFRGKHIKVESLSSEQKFDQDVVVCCAGSAVSKQLKGNISKSTWLIDKTSAFRMCDNVPLIVPEINVDLINEKQKIIACPNCVAIPLAMCLKPILNVSDIDTCFISTYQSVSGAGVQALKMLSREQKDHDMHIEEPPKHFPKHIAMNVIPHVDVMHDDLWTEEEIKIEKETNKILGTKFEINASCVRVGVPVGHAANVTVKLKNTVPFQKIVSSVAKSETVLLVEGKDRYITPREAKGLDYCFMSRLRVKPDNPKMISFWFACDNLRKGAALNAFQIMKVIQEKYLKH